MKKRKAVSIPLLILFLSICLSNALAKPVDTLVAKHVALNFMAAKTQNPSRSTPTAQLIYTGTYQNPSTSRSANCFYIFSTSNGFVIVSADDRIEPILGYSTEGRIDLHGMPVNIEEILDGYTQEIKLFLQNATPEPNAATEKWRKLADNTYMIHEKAAVIGPLLKTRWNQSSPYNLHCPDSNGQGQHALTGCVATAMAQIIRYWEYPTQGVGTKSYTCNNASSSNNYYGDYGTLTVNFGIGSYNYNYMPEVIDYNSSSAQINAVARLSYHCGVSVQMTYGIYASAASTSNAVNALSNYFKYSTTYNTLTPEFKSKSNYSDADWVNMIKSELNAWRPVIYSGSGSGGHSFICDGYDNQGYFHFNWGWGGYLDGYFLLTALTPTGHNYTSDQAAIFYIQGRTPLIRTSSDELSFIAPIGNHSNSQILSLCGVALSNNIVASVPAGFQISTDNIQYGNSLTLGTGVSQVYIRYAPTIATIGVENAVLTLSSGSTTKTIALTGRTYDLDCNPPQNLQGSAELQDVQLSWQAPTQDIHTYTFSLDSSVNYGRRVGFGVTSYTMVNRLCEPELILYHQKLLKKISFYVIPASYTSYKIVVYRGGKYQNGGYSEGTLVLEQSANITSSGWNTVTLNSPVVIDAEQELWYGVLLNCPSNAMPIPVGTNPAIVGQGDLVRINGSWLKLSNFNGYEYNIPFKISIEDSPAAITNYTIERNNTPVGTTTGTQFHEQQNTSGAYTYNVTANWDNGCSATSEDITVHVITDCEATMGDTTASVCDSFNWYEHSDITSSGNYSHTIVGGNVHGCDSIVTLHLTVNPTYYIPENVTVTQGSLPYLWHGRTFHESATAYDSLLTGAGCDSVHFLNLTVTPFSVVTDTPIAFCQGGSQVWRGRTLTQAGDYRDTVLAENNIYTVTVTVNPTYYIPENVTVTQGSLPYLWHGRTFLESATAYDSLLTGAGCDSVHFLNLTVTAFNIVEDEPIAFCQGDSQTWRGRTLTQAGDYRDTVLAENTIYTVTVTVNPTYYIPENVTVTQGSLPYTWHGRTFYGNATAYDSLLTGAGCDSVHYLNLTVTPFSIVEDEPIAFCQGGSQIWRGRTLTQAGEYRDTVLAENTIYTVVVTVNPTYYIPENITITQGSLPYTWHGRAFHESATAYDSLLTGAGCDSVHYLNLTVTPFSVVTDSPIAFCQGGSQVWRGRTLTQAGNYRDTVLAENTIYTVVVTVNPTYYLPENVTVTQSSLPYTWHGRAFYGNAIAYDSLLTGAGCDSVHYLNLTVTPFNIVEDEPISFCQGGSQIWRGRTLTQAGDYRDTVLTENTIYTVVVSINPTYYLPENVTVTQGSLPYTWHGRTFYGNATAYDSLLTGAGCDSVHYLNLTVTPFSIVEDEPIAFCQGGSQVWRGRTLTQAGDYRDTVLNENTIYTVTVTVNPTYYIPENVTVTQGSLPYNWHGRTFHESATAYDSLLTGAGCDSVHYLNLSVTPFSIVEDEPIAFCQGGSQVWRGRTLTQAGNYRDTALAENTIYTVTVTVNPTYYLPENVTVTQGSLPYLWHGRTFYGNATAYDSLLTGAGCDSVHYLNLSVTPFSIVDDEPIAFCQGGAQVWRGRTLTQAGNYRDTVLAENTIYTVTVTVNPTYYIPENVTVTQGSLPYTWHGRAFHESATAYDSLFTGTGCDSVHYLNLTVTPFSVVTDSPISFCQGGSQIWRGRTLTQAGDYRDTVLNENTIHTVTVTVNPTYFLPENVTVTQGSLPYNWHGRTFHESATAYDSLLTGAGCDSVHYLNLTVTPFSVMTDSPISFCQGGSQIWRGRTLTQAGNYRDTVLAENTIYTVTVTVNPTYYIPENVTVTQGSLPYTWHGRAFYGNAIAYDSLLTGAGCDSVHYLNLTVTPFNIVEDEPIAFCQGSAQVWRGRTLTQAGNYRDTVLNENTIYTVTVTVNPTYYIPENVTVTQGSLPYTWHGRTFYGNATAYDSLLTGAGCDSVHYLNLTVTAFNIVEDEPIAFCQGGSQIWRGRTLTQAGNYRDTALAENTIYTVTVTVNPTYYIPENITVTQGSLPYTWHGRTFYGNATAYDSLLTGAGCDSVHYLNLSVTPFSIVEDEPIAFCQGGSQIWRGRTLTQEGDYRDTVLTENTIYTVTVTVNPTYAVDTTVTITTNELPYHFVSGQIDTTFEEGTPDSSTLNFHLSTIHGCDSTITLHLTILTGIVHHPMEQTLRAFPNPTSGQLTVTGSADFTQIQLFDAYGRQIKTYSVEENQIEIDLHGLADGVYFIKAMRHKQMVGAIRIIKNGQ